MDKVALLDAFDEFIEKVEPAWQKFNDIADENFPAVEAEAFSALNRFDETVRMGLLRGALKAEDSIGAELAIDFNRIERILKPLGALLGGTLVEASAAAAEDLLIAIRRAAAITKADVDLGMQIGFDLGLSFEQAERWAAENAGIMITQVTNETKLAVREIIQRSFAEGIPPVKAAREIRQIVGLNTQQANAVINFRRKLETQMAAGKSPFKTVPLTPGKIDSMTAKFTKKHIKLRSEMIARTETIRSSNMGQQAIWEESVRSGIIDADIAVRRWVVTPDDRLCDFCAPMDGQESVISGQFQSGVVPIESGELRSFDDTISPPLHPRCRCAMVLDTKTVSVDTSGIRSGINTLTAALAVQGGLAVAEAAAVEKADVPTKMSDFTERRESLRSGVSLSQFAKFGEEPWLLKSLSLGEVVREALSVKAGLYFGVEVPTTTVFENRGRWWLATKSMTVDFPGSRSARMFISEPDVNTGTPISQFDSTIIHHPEWQRMWLLDAFIGNDNRQKANYGITGPRGSVDGIDGVLSLSIDFPDFKTLPAGINTQPLDDSVLNEFRFLLENLTLEITEEWIRTLPEALEGNVDITPQTLVSRANTLLEALS